MLLEWLVVCFVTSPAVSRLCGCSSDCFVSPSLHVAVDTLKNAESSRNRTFSRGVSVSTAAGYLQENTHSSLPPPSWSEFSQCLFRTEVMWSRRRARFRGDDLGHSRNWKEEEALLEWLVCLSSSPLDRVWTPGGAAVVSVAWCRRHLVVMLWGGGGSNSAMSSGWASASPPGCLRPQKTHRERRVRVTDSVTGTNRN